MNVVKMSVKTETHLGGRRFYDLPSAETDAQTAREDGIGGFQLVDGPSSVDGFLRHISDNVVGCDATFSGPFGRRKIVYADYTASGRALSFIEKYIYQVMDNGITIHPLKKR